MISLAGLKNHEVKESETSLVVYNDAIALVQEESEERGEFELFPKLPIELRLRIWNLTFQKQHVDLEIRKFWATNDWYRYYRWENYIPLPPKFPVALQVNRESRIETLHHYCIISSGDSRLSRVTHKQTPPTCVNFSLDSCFFEFGGLCRSKYESPYANWLSKLRSNARGGLSTLTELEIRAAWWNIPIQEEVDRDELYKFTGVFRNSGHFLLELRVALRFTGLKRLCVTWSQHTSRDPESQKDCRESIQGFMDRKRDSFIGGQAPDVKVRAWSKFYQVYVCSTSYGENIVEKV